MDDINRYYEILELKSGASPEEVKRAYRDLVRVWHPDRFSHDPRLQQKAQDKLKEINEAYEKLQAFLSGQRARAYRSGSRPSQSRPHSESGEARSSDSRAAPDPPPHAETARENTTASSVGIWPAIVAWLRNEYELMPTVVKIAVTVVLLLIVITSTQNSRSKQTIPEPDKTPLVASAPKPLSEPQGTVARPGRKAGPEDQATRPPSKDAPARKKATAKLETPPAGREAGGEHAVSPRLPSGYFTIGSSKDDVLAIQGEPSSIIGSTFHYGYSSVHFRGDRVSGYSNISNNLKVRLLPGAEASGASSRGYFTTGSSKDDVLAVQGTPSSVIGSTFHYGYSSVHFRGDRVSGYSNISNNLRVRLLPDGDTSEASSRAYFTIGSTKEEVLAIQGTPSSVIGGTFHYGYSSVHFRGDRVSGYSNISNNLKVRVTLSAERSP